MSGFGFLWALTGASGFDGSVAGMVIVVAALVTTTTIWLAAPVEREVTEVPADWPRRFNRIGAMQAVAILGVVVVLGRLEMAAFIPSAVCAIVGLHFLPLARLFDQTRFRWTAVALLAVAAIGAATAPFAGGGPARALVGLGAAVVLWSSTVPLGLPTRVVGASYR